MVKYSTAVHQECAVKQQPSVSASHTPKLYTHAHNCCWRFTTWGVFSKKTVLYHAKTSGSCSQKHKLTLTAEQVCVLPSTVHCDDSLPTGHKIMLFFLRRLRQLPVLLMSTSEQLNPCRNDPYCAALCGTLLFCCLGRRGLT